MDFLTGAMGALLPKLVEVVHAEYNLQMDIKVSISNLHRELLAMQAAIPLVAKLRPDHPAYDETMLWASELRDLSYDAEDIIDSLLLQGSEPDKDHGGFEGLVPRMIELCITLKNRHDISGAIDGLTKEAKDLDERRKRYKVDVAANPNATSTPDPRVSVWFQDPNHLVGVNASRDEVIKRLNKVSDNKTTEKNPKIVSVFGIGGLGKTTLARAVYDRLEARYKVKAFVSVSQNPDLKKVFLDILIGVDRDNYWGKNSATFDVFHLIQELRKILERSRYFIVIDDVWDLQAWEIIKTVLVDNKHANIVLTTTRILKVAGRAGDVYKLKPLSNVLSEQLFYTRYFGGKGKFPAILPDVPARLLSKCGGVPLAIVTMASVLAKKQKSDWDSVYNQIGFGSHHDVNKDIMVENTRAILQFSYHDLPDYLRTCLLHLNIYPEDYLIPKETLIWKWVAEGFVHEEPGTGLFEIGERYFMELIDRSVIMPVEDPQCHNIITGCRLHDLVLDMISGLSTKVNFVTLLDGDVKQFQSGVDRRLAVRKRDTEQKDPFANKSKKKLRSFYATEYDFNIKLSLDMFIVLRVLALEKCTFLEGGSYNLKELGKLLRLRYLGLCNSPIDELPEEIGGLNFLQTLDVRGTRVQELPASIGLLKQLKCLRADDTTRVPDWMGNLTSLEELRLDDVSPSSNFVTELGKLTELRELEIWLEDLKESSNKALVESLCKLHKIQVLGLLSSLPVEESNWENYKPSPRLRELRMNIEISRLPAWIEFSSVPKLSHLSVEVKAVEEKDLEILGKLPELVSLKLLMPSHIFPSIEGGDAFPKLRCFDTSAPFSFLPGAMPRLESLHFKVDVQALKRAEFEFQSDFASLKNLLELQKVEVEISCKGAREKHADVAEAAVKRTVEEHQNSPTIAIKITNK